MAEDNKHAKFAPSASERWLACPGSIRLTEELTKKLGEIDTGSIYAFEGTVCHKIAENCLRDSLNPADFIGQSFESPWGTVVINKEHTDAIQMYINTVKNIGLEHHIRGGELEKTVEIAKNCFGTIDCNMNGEDFVIIIDLKMGKGHIVPAIDNPQAKLYGIGAIKAHPYPKKVKKVIVVIVQPRTPDPVRVWEVSRQELLQWWNDVVKPAMTEANGDNPQCHPGENQCRWCPASSHCAVQADWIAGEMMSMITGESESNIMSVTGNDLEMDAAIDHIETMPLEKIAHLLELVPHFQNWMKTIQDYAMTQALAGETIPGYKLVEGRSYRKWKEEDEKVTEWLRDVGKIDPFEQKLLSVAKAERTIGKKKAQGLGFEQLVHKPPGAPTLVPLSDNRPPIKQEVEQEFADFAEGEEDWFSQEGGLLTDEDTGISYRPDKVDPETGRTISDSRHIYSQMQRREMAEESDQDILDELAVEADEEGIDDLLPGETFDNEKQETKPEKPIKSVTGDSPDDPIIMQALPFEKTKIPDKRTIRFKVYELGMDNPPMTITKAAQKLGKTEAQIKMHLRYLNEKDGIGYRIRESGIFRCFLKPKGVD